MSTLQEKFQEWVVCETTGLCEASMVSIPSNSALQQLTLGKNKKFCQYIIEHVKSKQTVLNIKNVLRVKKAQCKLINLYPPINKNCEALKQEIKKTEEKGEFVENSLSNIRKSIFNLKQGIKSLRGRNHVISQKCTFLEIEVLKYNEKNESLTVELENIFSLLRTIFSPEENIQCYQNLIVQKSLELNTNVQPPDDTIRYLLFQMSSIIKNVMLKKNERLSFSELLKSFKRIGSDTNVHEFVAVMKQQLKQSEDLLNKNNYLSAGFAYQPQQKKFKMSLERLQMLKLDQVNSSLQRLKIINYSNKIPLLEKVISSKNRIIFDLESQTLREFIFVKAQNVCLEENIKYLESNLSEELHNVKNILVKNNEQKSKSVLLKSVVQNFYQILECIQVLVETISKTFLEIESKLISNNEFLKSELFSSLSQLKDELNVCEIKSNLLLNYTGSLDILQSTHFLKTPLNYSDSYNLELSEKFWKFFAVKPFNSLYLLSEKLTHLKREIIAEKTVFKCDTNEITETFECMDESFKSKFEHLKLITRKTETETKSNCQGLKSFFHEWWHQNAQFIPEIVYDGKSLKMWIDILNALGDF